MKWAWKVGDYFGIDVKIHATFLLIIGWVALLQSRDGLWAVVDGVAFVLAIFFCVLLHEFGHSLTARKYGIRTQDITLLPIGGVARLERMPEDPRQELWVALAGPAVNVAISALLFVILWLNGGLASQEAVSVTAGSFWGRLLLVNLFLALFNMLPAFPMDGGRVLRALLASRMDYVRSTQIAANIGQGSALLFGLLGLFSNPFLIFIAVFIWIGAKQEAAMVAMKASISGIPVNRLVPTNFTVFSPHNRISEAVALMLGGSQQDFPVVRDRSLVGILTRSNIMNALEQHDLDAPLSQFMERQFETLESSEMLDTALLRLQSASHQVLAVTQNGMFSGLITADNLGRFLAIQSALRQSGGDLRGRPDRWSSTGKPAEGWASN